MVEFVMTRTWARAAMYPTLIALLVWPASMPEAAPRSKELYCRFAVPAMARSAFCSVNQTKCGAMSVKTETKADMIIRLQSLQQPNYYNRYLHRYEYTLPVLNNADVEFLIDEAIKTKLDSAEAFAAEKQEDCFATYDQVQEDNDRLDKEQSITR